MMSRPDINPGVARKLLRRRQFRKLLNYLAAELQAWAGLPYALAKPYWLTIDPTNFCQLKCPFCPTGSGRQVRPNTVMEMDLFRRLMAELGPTLLHADFMNWGEPLLNPRLPEMLALAKTYGVETMISTNLNFLPPGRAAELVGSGLDRLVVSIDGASQETYAKYRVGGDFAAVIANLRQVLAARAAAGGGGPRVIWQFLVFRHNEHEIERARAMAAELGVDEIGFTAPCLPFRPGIKDEWMARDRQYCLYDPDAFPETPPWEWESARDAEGKPKNVEVKVYSGKEARRPCKWPWTGITVNADGSVSPCCSVEERQFDFGDLLMENPGRIWNNVNYRRARAHIRRFAAGRGDSLPASANACERCFSIGKADFQLPAGWNKPDDKVSKVKSGK
ncbi:MAG: radical SAM protein [Elusimicrobiales bacterium]|nr:radical SAM protein [Elusimicrobiales bacterium]